MYFADNLMLMNQSAFLVGNFQSSLYFFIKSSLKCELKKKNEMNSKRQKKNYAFT